jgi:TrmH family RNA methyltransferase
MMLISSAQNSKVKLLRGLLGARKNREESGLFVIEGVRLAEEAIKSGAQTEFTLFSNQLSTRGRELLRRKKD